MSELYKPKKSPFWYYTITDQNGNRARCSTKTSNKQVAKTILRAAEQKVLFSGITALRKAPALGEFIPEFETWVENHASLKPSTKRFYRCGVELLKASKLASLRLTAITNDDCVTTVFAGGAYNANKALRTLRSILTRAESRGLFPGKLPKITMRKVDRRAIHMTRSHCVLIASKMPECESKDVLLILRYTGMRPNEAMSARWEYVDWLTLRYRVPSGKSENAARTVPLLGESLVVLKRRHLAQGMPAAGWIFPSDSSVGHLVTIKRAFDRARDAAGLPKKMVPYCARHGFLTDLAGVASTAEVMRLGGHSSAQIAMTYQHPEASTAELQNRLDEASTTGRIQ